MDKELIRMKRLAGILTEGVMAVPGIGEQTESETQTQSNAAQGQAYSDFDISQGGLEEGIELMKSSGHEIIANRKTPRGEFIVLRNKNDGKYEIHKFVGPDSTTGYEFKSSHTTPEEMQAAFKKLTGIDEQTESEMQTQSDDAQGQAYSNFDISQGGLEEETAKAIRVFHKAPGDDSRSRADRAAVAANPALQQDRDAAAAAAKQVRSSTPHGSPERDVAMKKAGLSIHRNSSVAREDVMPEGEQTCNECGSVMYEGHACGVDSMEEAKRSTKPERFDARELAHAWGGHQAPEPGKEPGTLSVQHKIPPFSDNEDDEDDETYTYLRDLQRRAGITPAEKDPHVHAKQLARDNPEDPAGNFIQGGRDLDIFKETEESLDEAYMSSEDAEKLVLQYGNMGLFDIEHQDNVLRSKSDSQLDELVSALSILIREYDLVPSLRDKYLQTYRNILDHLEYRKSLRGLSESQKLSEKKMKAKHKTKEKKLKKKYDKSGMKKSMIKQYGKEKGKQVYFAKIRGEAMKESSEFDQVFSLDDLDISIAESLYELEEAYDLNNGYYDQHHAVGDDYFPDGADSPVVDEVGPSGARQGDNPEQKKMQVATESVHRELVYGYRKFLKESS